MLNWATRVKLSHSGCFEAYDYGIWDCAYIWVDFRRMDCMNEIISTEASEFWGLYDPIATKYKRALHPGS